VPAASDKKFRLNAEQIKPLATGHGACFATDLITVDGRAAAFMYREAPDRDIDSGWRFLSGFESDDLLEVSGLVIASPGFPTPEQDAAVVAADSRPAQNERGIVCAAHSSMLSGVCFRTVRSSFGEPARARFTTLAVNNAEHLYRR
jgi:hypothetical protein